MYLSIFPKLRVSLCLLNCHFRSRTSEKPTGSRTRNKIKTTGTENFEGLYRQKTAATSVRGYMASESSRGKQNQNSTDLWTGGKEF